VDLLIGFYFIRDSEVRLLVACCLADIMRVYAPESPYTDAEVKVCVATEVISMCIGVDLMPPPAGRRCLRW
jgi:sister-chromatid-cohesion protein PDS5